MRTISELVLKYLLDISTCMHSIEGHSIALSCSIEACMVYTYSPHGRVAEDIAPTMEARSYHKGSEKNTLTVTPVMLLKYYLYFI